MAKREPWQYGKHKNPTNWRDAADALKSQKKTKRKSTSFADKLDSIEQLLKDHK